MLIYYVRIVGCNFSPNVKLILDQVKIERLNDSLYPIGKMRITLRKIVLEF